MSAPKRITPEELLQEFKKDGIECGKKYAHVLRGGCDYVDDTFTAVHATFDRILDERLSRIEKVLRELH